MSKLSNAVKTNIRSTNNHGILTIAILNCRSIRSETKVRDFKMFVREHSPDIIMGTESWLSNDISDAEVFPNGYVTTHV